MPEHKPEHKPSSSPATGPLPAKINVLLMGSGGREHAMAMKLARSARLGVLYATGTENPGIHAVAKPVDVPVNIREAYRLQQFIEKNDIGLVVIGPEEPLAEGFADKLASKQTMVFGPTAEGARLEADKAWCKQIMRSAAIPTAEARAFTDAAAARKYIESRVMDDPILGKLFGEADEYNDAEQRAKFIEQQCNKSKEVHAAVHAARPGLPVIKASGLAKGKGVVVPGTLSEALNAIERIMVRREFGDAGRTVVIEQRLEGTEVSVLAITDGTNILVLPPAKDHKRLGDGDTGPNTGGMGVYCPSSDLDDKTMAIVERDVLVPVLDALRREGIEFRGVLYAGIMLTHAGPRVLEFNCRFGDPECQPMLSRLKSDFLDLCLHACRGTLDQAQVEWDTRAACCVVLASQGYPEKPKVGVPITGLDAANLMRDVTVFHAATKRGPDGRIVTNGGRVLGVNALGATLAEARAKAYAAVDAIQFEGKTFRRDIGA